MYSRFFLFFTLIFFLLATAAFAVPYVWPMEKFYMKKMLVDTDEARAYYIYANILCAK